MPEAPDPRAPRPRACLPLHNTRARYGRVAMAFHWLTVALIFTLLPLGLIANRLPYATSAALAQKAWLFSLHKTLGVSVLAVAILRILWALHAPRPAPLHPRRRFETALAGAVRWLLYISIVAVPLSGWLEHAATSGFAPIWWPFGQSLPLVPKSEPLAALFSGWHRTFTKLLLAVVILHIVGALKHLWIDHDQTLARMWPRALKVSIPIPAAPARASHAPALGAIGLYIAAIVLSTVLGQKAPPATATTPANATPQPGVPSAPTPAASARQNVWQVVDGSLKIGVKQFGSAVAGEFSDWHATITFNPDFVLDDPEARQGHATVDVAIDSLHLGSVTAQALGYDFFDAAHFPTARFSADIMPANDGYEAGGTLTIKGITKPLKLPFSLAIKGDIATMHAKIALDRRAFHIGANLPDEQSLGFDVTVEVALTARRQGVP